jgi:hypothetical protein|tara:strand:+ start:385 stop:579 length:195 start_codon:yes stop_codon:yes gene_type:complete
MIKWIKNLFCKIIGIKQCECPEDEHIELYTKIPEPEVPIYEEKKHCERHSRFIKRCPDCIEVVK